MTIEEIKSLMKSGDVAGAENAAQQLLAAEPGNIQAMMLYGTCRRLQGDEATFLRIHDELAPKMAAVVDGETREAWRRFDDMNQDASAPFLVAERSYPDDCTLYGCIEYRELEVYGCSSFETLRRMSRRRCRQRFSICFVFVIVTFLLCWLAWWLGQVL